MKKTMSAILGIFACSFVFSAVEFMGFNAEIQNNAVLLTWSTATETENIGFILERKTDSLGAWNPLDSYLTNDSLLGQGTVSFQSDYAYADSSVMTGETYHYRISGVDEGGSIGLLDSLSITVSETSVQDIVPNEFSLRCYPNPFNPSLTISYQLTTGSRVKASVYNIAGMPVENLLNRDMEAGAHELIWNARGNPSGVYFLKMIAGDMVRSQKLILLK
jgi:hypothetical protein